MRQLLEPLAAGQTVRIIEESTFYTPTEAGRMLGVSRQYIDKLIARGELPVTHKPESSHRLIDAADIEAIRARRERRRQGVDAMVDTLIDGGAEY
ncbi:MAG: helix-turn-helix domain-containing protein [Acidimicrobiales bacterium]